MNGHRLFSGRISLRHRFRQLAAFLGVLTLSSVSLVAINSATATADAGNPILGSISASLVTNGDGSVTVSVRGQWNWLSHNSDCNTDRAGAGLGVIWNDPTEPGYTVSKGAISAEVGIKTLRAGDVVNTVDQMVHPADLGNIPESYPGFTGQTFFDPAPPAPASFATWRGGCGREPLSATASQPGNPASSGVSCANGTTNCANHPWGSWGFAKNGGMGYSHTYASRSDVSSVCVNFYDVHGGGTGTKLQDVNGSKEITVDGNGDNSIETNAFNPVQGENCVFFPNLQITKTADAASVTAGNPIGFTIGVHNAGSGVAHSAVINDALPTGAGISWSISPAYAGPGTCAITSNNLHCDLGDFAAGATASVHVTSATSFASCAEYPNTATTSASDNTEVSASATTTVGCPNLSITKTADATTVNAGDNIGFTVTAHNSGAFAASGVTISDALPGGAGVNWSISPAYAGPGTCSITGSAPNQTLSCNVGTLAANASASVHVTSGTSFASCAEYPNSASADATNNPTVGPATASITVQCPDLSITKTADDQFVSAGTNIGFTINVSNAGPGTAKSVTLSDPLPTGAGISWSIDPAYSGPGTCSITANTLNCNFGDLAAAASASVHITSATSKDTACTAYPNTATVHSTNHPDEDASATTTVQCPGMNITKTADATTVNAGANIGFTIGVSNGGPGAATGVTLNDPLPHGDGVSWSISPAYSGPGTCSITGSVPNQVLSCSFGDLAAGDSASIHITSATSFLSCAVYHNTATASTTNDGSPSADATITVQCPDLSITKTADDQVVSAGTNIGFTIGVHNAGPGVATAATLSDPLPTGSGISWSISPAYSGPGTCSITANTLNCNFGDLASGASASVHVTSATSSATACVEYPNTATVSASNHPDEDASATTTVTCPSLHITKTADDGTVNAGDNIGFSIGVSNSGPGTATGATLSDPLPGGSGISWSISPAYSGPGTCSITGSVPNQTLSCAFGDLGSGDSASVHVTSTTAFQSCATYTNEATAAATNDGTVSASADTTVDCPDIAISKIADASPVSTGDPIGFTVTVSNADTEGTGTARSVTLSDPLPDGNGVSWIISPAYSGPGTCSITGSAPNQLLSCAFGDMGPGDSASVHISSSTTADSAGTYPNTATASATNAPPVEASAEIVVLAPALSITKTADASPVNTGDQIGFTVTVSNADNEDTGTAHDVMVSDPLPGGSGVDWSISPDYSGPGTCSIDGSAPDQTLNCDLGDMAPGDSASVHIVSDTTADSAGTYDNTATATASNAPPVEASAEIVVLAPALSITKTADAASVTAPAPIGFTVTVSNSAADGTGIARSVTVNDPLPSGSGVSWSISPAYSGPGTCSITGSAPNQVLTCDLGDMAPGDSASVHIVSDTTAASAGQYPNTATATPTNGPPVSATATTSVIVPTPVTLQGSTTTTTTTTTTVAPAPITLPFTGSNSSPLIKWGLLLFATGGALVLRRGRRRWARR